MKNRNVVEIFCEKTKKTQKKGDIPTHGQIYKNADTRCNIKK